MANELCGIGLMPGYNGSWTNLGLTRISHSYRFSVDFGQESSLPDRS